jgi:N6-L-threonylcarbamoyladenine synthase
MTQDYKILAIDTSCDETSAAVTNGKNILSNIVWSQASLHAVWGGVFPSLAQREHRERIDWVITKAIKSSGINFKDLNAIAVTAGPGLAITLEVGITKAKELAHKYGKPLIAVNHIEAHALSFLVQPKTLRKEIKLTFPFVSIVVSGGNTLLILVKDFGRYEILTQTQDDALGEALDKAARMLGLGYPGGAILEKFALSGNPLTYPLPIPMLGKEDRLSFSYSGLKTAFFRLIEKVRGSKEILNKKEINDLASSFQNMAFVHLIRIITKVLAKEEYKNVNLISLGGGVGANKELRKRIRKMAKSLSMKAVFPYSKKLFGDNAAMVGVTAYFQSLRKKFEKEIDIVDRDPSVKIGEEFKWEKDSQKKV